MCQNDAAVIIEYPGLIFSPSHTYVGLTKNDAKWPI